MGEKKLHDIPVPGSSEETADTSTVFGAETVEPGPRSGVVSIPASKSQAHRLLICAALSEKDTVVRCATVSADIMATTDCLRALGAQIEIAGGMLHAKAESLKAAHIYFDVVTVGGTINVMMAAVMAKGQTIIENAAREPHIVDVANFLNSMGANIKGAGTDVIRIMGVEKLHATEYSIIPDQIEAGTFMFAAACTHGDVTVKNVIPKHLEATSAKLVEVGCQLTEYDDAVRVAAKGPLRHTQVTTLAYPGFPTDMQPQMTVVLSTVRGTSTVTETIFENRFMHVDELINGGAKVRIVQYGDVGGQRRHLLNRSDAVGVCGGTFAGPREVEFGNGHSHCLRLAVKVVVVAVRLIVNGVGARARCSGQVFAVVLAVEAVEHDATLGHACRDECLRVAVVSESFDGRRRSSHRRIGRQPLDGERGGGAVAEVADTLHLDGVVAGNGHRAVGHDKPVVCALDQRHDGSALRVGDGGDGRERLAAVGLGSDAHVYPVGVGDVALQAGDGDEGLSGRGNGERIDVGLGRNWVKFLVAHHERRAVIACRRVYICQQIHTHR